MYLKGAVFEHSINLAVGLSLKFFAIPTTIFAFKRGTGKLLNIQHKKNKAKQSKTNKK